jgi:hypothetical protein
MGVIMTLIELINYFNKLKEEHSLDRYKNVIAIDIDLTRPIKAVNCVFSESRNGFMIKTLYLDQETNNDIQ